jgi:hypothetical protein
VLRAYRWIWLPFEFFGYWVRAAYKNGMCLSQFIPQPFKFNGGLHSSVSTEKRNHLPEQFNSLVLNLSAANQRRNGGQESLAARSRILHEF